MKKLTNNKAASLQGGEGVCPAGTTPAPILVQPFMCVLTVNGGFCNSTDRPQLFLACF